MRILITTVLILGVSPDARADCPIGAVPNGVSARVDSAGVQILQQVLVDQLPNEVIAPAASFTLNECPLWLDDTVVSIPGGPVYLAFRGVHVSLHQGAVELDAELDVAMETDLDLEVCLGPNAEGCHADLQAQGIRVHARVEPNVVDCAPEMPITVIDIDVPSDTTVIDLSDCGLYDEIGELLYDWFQDTILDLVTQRTASAVQEFLPGLVETFTSDLLATGVDLMGLHVEVAPESIAITPAGVHMTASAAMVPISHGDCLPSDATTSAPGTVNTPGVPSNAMVSVVVAEAVVQQAVESAWLAGLMCFDSRDYNLDLSALSTALEGFTTDPTLEAVVSPITPPMVRFGDQGDIDVEVAELTGEVTIGTSIADPLEIGARMSAALSGRAGVDVARQSLTLELLDAQSEGVEVTTQSASLALTAEGLSNLFDDIILPAFAGSVGPLPLLSGLFVYAPVGVRVTEVAVEGEHLRADLELAGVDLNDNEPPNTVLDQLPPELCGPSVQIAMRSSDDTTAPEFLRHTVVVDGVAVERLYGGSTIERSLAGGEHIVAIAAVDLNDNTDPTPLEVLVRVDAVAPEVTFNSDPIGVSLERSAHIEVSARDDHTPPDQLDMRYTVGRIMPEGPDELLEEGALTPGAALELSNLPEDSLVRVTVFATDQVGNEGSGVFAFAINASPTFSCAATPSWWAMILLAAALLAHVVRRRWAR